MVSLNEQRDKISSKDPKPDMVSIVTRMNLIRTALGTAGNHLRDTQQAYENILKEMEFKATTFAERDKYLERMVHAQRNRFGREAR